MSEAIRAEQTEALTALCAALGYEAHVLCEHPRILAQQVHNRLLRSGPQSSTIDVIIDRAVSYVRSTARPWFRAANARHASGSGSDQLVLSRTADFCALAVRPGYRQLATLDGSRVCLWDIDAKREVASTTHRGASVVGIAWMPDGDKLLVGYKDGAFRLLSSDGLALVREYRVDGANEMLDFSLAGDDATLVALVAGSGGDSRIVIGDSELREWEAVATPAADARRVAIGRGWSRVATGPGRRVVFSGCYGVKSLDAETGAEDDLWDQCVREFYRLTRGVGPEERQGDFEFGAWLSDVETVAAHPASGMAAWGDKHGDVCLTDLVSGKIVAFFPGKRTACKMEEFGLSRSTMQIAHDAAVQCLAFSTDGRLFASGSGGPRGFGARPGDLCVWDVETASLVSRARFSSGLESVAFLEDGSGVAVAGQMRLSIEPVSQSQRWVERVPGADTLDDYLGLAAFSEDGDSLAYSSWGDIMFVHGEHPSEPERVFAHTGKVTSLHWDSARHLVASCGMDGVCCVWDGRDGSQLNRFEYPHIALRAARFSPDGGTLCMVGYSGLCVLVDMREGARKGFKLGDGLELTCVAFSADGRFLAVGGRQAAFVMDLSLFTAKATFSCGSPVQAIEFTRSGVLITGGLDGVCKLWDVEESRSLGAFDGHLGIVNEVLCHKKTPGLVITTSGDQTCRLWPEGRNTEIGCYVADTWFVGAGVIEREGVFVLVDCIGNEHRFLLSEIASEERG